MNTETTVDILLAEDELMDIELTVHALRKLGMAENLHVVHDGAEALDFLFGEGIYATRDQSHHLKMILLDLKLPKVHGLEVLTRIKSDQRTRGIPVVVLTASQEERDIMRSLNLGVLAYIVKPFNIDKFINAIATRKYTPATG